MTYLDFSDAGYVAGDGRTGRVEGRSWQGQPGHSLRLFSDDSSRLAGAGDMLAYQTRIEQRAQRMADPAQYLEMAKAGLDAWGGVPRLPYLAGLVTDGERIAIRMYTNPEDSVAAWHIYAKANGGTPSGILMVPEWLKVMSLRGDSLIVVRRDSLDVESVLFLRFTGSL